MSINVSAIHGTARCDAACSDCDKEATIQLGVEMSSIVLCLTCARKVFTACGFIIMSQTGESIERLVGLRKRRGDK